MAVHNRIGVPLGGNAEEVLAAALAAGTPYVERMNKEILGPLGMSQTA